MQGDWWKGIWASVDMKLWFSKLKSSFLQKKKKKEEEEFHSPLGLGVRAVPKAPWKGVRATFLDYFHFPRGLEN